MSHVGKLLNGQARYTCWRPATDTGLLRLEGEPPLAGLQVQQPSGTIRDNTCACTPVSEEENGEQARGLGVV